MLTRPGIGEKMDYFYTRVSSLCLGILIIVISVNSVSEVGTYDIFKTSGKFFNSLRRTRRGSINKDVRGFSNEEKNTIQKLHNDYRRMQNASNMKFLYWNSDLEKLAQKWSENCNYEHSSKNHKQSVDEFRRIGENLFISSGMFKIHGVVRSWYKEVKDFNYDNVTCTPGKMCGHYKQVVWAKSEAVGCGAKYCPILRNANFRSGYLVTCNYGPAGNYRGAKPYKIGRACSMCEEAYIYCHDKLCSKSPSTSFGVNPSADVSCLFISITLALLEVTQSYMSTIRE